MHRVIIIGVLGLHAVLLLDGSRRNFVTVDEVGHIPAGISHWQTGTYSMYRVNPPLARMLAVLPVLAQKPNTDGIEPVATPGVRTEFTSGIRFATNNSDRYMQFVWLARLSTIVWSIIGGLIIYRWARDLYGERAGWLGLALWCFGPNVLANAQLVTPDIPNTVAGLGATYVFWRYLRNPTWLWALFAGFLLGIAQLTKLTALVFYGIWPVIFVVHRWGARRPTIGVAKQALHIVIMFMVSIVLLNAGYEFHGTGRRLGDFEFISSAFTGDPSTGSLRSVPAPTGNPFSECWFGKLPVPLPDEYVRGMDAQRLDFERGLGSYLAGEWRNRGWWYYYLYALAVKVPITTLALVSWGLLLTLFGHAASSHWFDEMTLWLPATAILVLVSSQTGFNHHLRYVLPMVPFVVIATSKLSYFWQWSRWKIGLLAAVLLLASVASSVRYHPHYLSYFNPIAGGPDNGHKHLVNSNIDWGQDLLFLKKWLDKHPEARPFHLAYCNLIDPRLVGIEYALPRMQTSLASSNESILGPQPGYHAVSVNYIKGWSGVAVSDGRGNRVVVPAGEYSYFMHFQPIAKAGYSIFIYHISRDEADRVRRELNLPPLSGASP